MTVVFVALEVPFFAGNVVKILDGGWVPLGVATVLFTVITTWRLGRQRVVTRLVEAEGSLDDLLAELTSRDVLRVPGTAVFPHASDETVPLALRANVDRNNVLHEHVVIISAGASRLAHVSPEDQLRATAVGPPAAGIVHLDLHYGFFDGPDIPAALAHAATSEPALADADFDNANYFLSRATLTVGRSRGMAMWRKHLFLLLAHNAADPGHTFALPSKRTVLMGAEIEI